MTNNPDSSASPDTPFESIAMPPSAVDAPEIVGAAHYDPSLRSESTAMRGAERAPNISPPPAAPRPAPPGAPTPPDVPPSSNASNTGSVRTETTKVNTVSPSPGAPPEQAKNPYAPVSFSSATSSTVRRLFSGRVGSDATVTGRLFGWLGRRVLESYEEVVKPQPPPPPPATTPAPEAKKGEEEQPKETPPVKEGAEPEKAKEEKKEEKAKGEKKEKEKK